MREINMTQIYHSSAISINTTMPLKNFNSRSFPCQYKLGPTFQSKLISTSPDFNQSSLNSTTKSVTQYVRKSNIARV